MVDATAGFALRLAGGRTVEARQVLLATGAVGRAARCRRRSRALGTRSPALPVLPRLGGARPADRRARDRPGSVEHAHLLRQWSDDVILFTHTHAVTPGERATLDARGIAVVDGSVERLVVDRRSPASGPARRRSQRPARRALHPPRAARARATGPPQPSAASCSQAGSSGPTPTGRTSVPGVWAAGNAANPRAQVITAAGEGSAVAIAINTELVEDDVDTAVQRVAATRRDRPSRPEDVHDHAENPPTRSRRRAGTSSP